MSFPFVIWKCLLTIFFCQNIVFARQSGSSILSEFGGGGGGGGGDNSATSDISRVISGVLARRGVTLMDDVILDSWRIDKKTSAVDRLVFRRCGGDANDAAGGRSGVNNAVNDDGDDDGGGGDESVNVDNILMFFSFAVKGKDFDMFQVSPSVF